MKCGGICLLKYAGSYKIRKVSLRMVQVNHKQKKND